MSSALADPTPRRTCFVVMPITDPTPYEQGHFRRVYEHIIKPSCARAGFDATRSDDVERTNHIILDVLRRVLQADVVLCDLSGRNPNVLYELGVRQAFNKPVVLIKDSQTERIFDIQGLRDIEYDAALRIDRIAPAVNAISAALTTTTDGNQEEINSLIQLLGVQAASVPQRTEISGETSLILNSLNDISKRLALLERSTPAPKPAKTTSSNDNFDDFPAALDTYTMGDPVIHKNLGKGKVVALKGDVVSVHFHNGRRKDFKDDDPELTWELPF
ncbi:MAG: hypothetical protein WKF55_08165 [Gemmatimonadaceae bacterium]